MSAHWPKEAPVSGISSQLLDISSTSNTIFVRNLSYEVDRPELQTFFENIGPVRNAFVVKEKFTDTSRGYGFVEFATEADAKTAVDRYNAFMWYDRPLRIELALQQHNDPKARVEAKKKHLEQVKQQKRKDEREEKKQIKEQRRAEKEKQLQEKAELKKQLKALEKKGKTGASGIVIPQDLADQNSGKIILICGLDDKVTLDEIKNKCKKFGAVSDVVYPAPESEPAVGDKPADFVARVTFDDQKHSDAAVKGLNGQKFGANRSIARVFALGGTASTRIARLIIRNLSFTAREDDVRELFSQYGRIVEVSFPRSATGHTRGFGFVQMDSFESAKKCVENLNGQTLLNRPFSVDFSLPKDKYDSISKRVELAETTKTTVESKSTGNDDSNVKKESSSTQDKIKQEIKDEDLYSLEPTPGETYNEDDDDDLADSELVYQGGDDDEDEDDDEDDESNDTNETENPKVSPAAQRGDVQQGATLFIRNLSYDTDDNALSNKFSTFGRVKLAIIVRDKVLHRSMGTAFVQFHDRGVADDVLERYGGHTSQAYDRKKHGRNSAVNPNIIRLDGRDLIISRAVDRNQAKKLEQDKTPMKKDRRRLYLAKEGVILPNTPASEGVSKADMDRRERGWNEKKKRLQNPNFSVSETRLSVRNIPFTMNEKELRTLVYSTVVKANKDQGKKVGDIKVRQVKIERDAKKFDQHGLPRSKGFGFVEFAHHEHSLTCLRELNNNPKTFTSTSRPIIEFALEDARKVLVHRKRRDRQITMGEKSSTVRHTAEQQALSDLLGESPAGTGASHQKKEGNQQLEKIFTKQAHKSERGPMKRGKPSSGGKPGKEFVKKPRNF